MFKHEKTSAYLGPLSTFPIFWEIVMWVNIIPFIPVVIWLWFMKMLFLLAWKPKRKLFLQVVFWFVALQKNCVLQVQFYSLLSIHIIF